jgi:hypothetical protein
LLMTTLYTQRGRRHCARKGPTDDRQVGTSATSPSAVKKSSEATSSDTSQSDLEPVDDVMPYDGFAPVLRPLSTIRTEPPRSAPRMSFAWPVTPPKEMDPDPLDGITIPLSVLELPGPWDLESSDISTSASNSATPADAATLRVQPPRSTTPSGSPKGPSPVFELSGPWDLYTAGISTSSPTSATPADQAIEAEKEVEEEKEEEKRGQSRKQRGKQRAEQREKLRRKQRKSREGSKDRTRSGTGERRVGERRTGCASYKERKCQGCFL